MAIQAANEVNPTVINKSKSDFLILILFLITLKNIPTNADSADNIIIILVNVTFTK